MTTQRIDPRTASGRRRAILDRIARRELVTTRAQVRGVDPTTAQVRAELLAVTL